MPRLFLVHPPHLPEPTSIAYMDEEARFFAYEPTDQQFHQADGIARDYFYDQWARYEEVDPATAAEWIPRFTAVAANVPPPRYDGPGIDAGPILGGNVVPLDSPRARAVSIAEKAKNAKDGGWVAYRRYPAARRSAAHAAASQIRAGRVKALPPGEFDAAASKGTDGTYTVFVRVKPAASTKVSAGGKVAVAKVVATAAAAPSRGEGSA